MILKRLSDYQLFLLAFYIVVGFVFTFSYKITKKAPQEVEIFVTTTAEEEEEVSRPETLNPPSDSTTENKKPQFTWKQAPNFSAQKYLFELSNTPSFINKLVEGSPKSTNFNPPKELDAGVYFWRVRGVTNNGDKSPWSFKSCFVVGPMQKAFPSPELASPVYERIKFVPGQPLTLTLKWQPSYYDPYCFVFPKKYLIQIGQDAYFNTVLYNTEVTTNKLVLGDVSILLNAMPQGVASTPFFWKVKPIDNWGKEGEWSKTENFYLVNSEISKL